MYRATITDSVGKVHFECAGDLLSVVNQLLADHPTFPNYKKVWREMSYTPGAYASYQLYARYSVEPVLLQIINLTPDVTDSQFL